MHDEGREGGKARSSDKVSRQGREAATQLQQKNEEEEEEEEEEKEEEE